MDKVNVDSICKRYVDQQFVLQRVTDSHEIFLFYDSFKNTGNREFLYLPTTNEVDDDLTRGMIYLGVIEIKSQKIVGMQEIFLLHISNSNTEQHIWYPDRFASFAFQPPIWDRDLKDKYFAVSGVYVAENYRNKGLATRMLNASLEIAETECARGVYGDPNYLNRISQSVISKHFDIIGFTDGVTSGPENEQSLYITYYRSLKSTHPPFCEIKINLNETDKEMARNTALQLFQQIGKLTKYELAYSGGINLVYVLDNIVIRRI